jgi:hypothetical protein
VQGAGRLGVQVEQQSPRGIGLGSGHRIGPYYQADPAASWIHARTDHRRPSSRHHGE